MRSFGEETSDSRAARISLYEFIATKADYVMKVAGRMFFSIIWTAVNTYGWVECSNGNGLKGID